MGALRQPRPSEPSKKPPVVENRKFDRYGRDPESLPEKLRARTDHDTGAGWAAIPFSAVADLPRLASGPTCYAFVLVVNALSLGRHKAPNAPRHEWTEPISAVDLAEYCRANVRDIQRQLSELAERGMIDVKQSKDDGVKYSIRLLYSKWRELEDYAVWKRLQVVEIDSADDEDEEDEPAQEISKDAVHLFKKPAVARPGRATRPAKVTVGVREVICQNDSPVVDASFRAVVTSGRLVVSATFAAKSESRAKGENKANDTGVAHQNSYITERVGLTEKRNKGETIRHPRAADVISVFDSPLKYWNSKLISVDEACLWSACAELGEMPADFLGWYVNDPKKGRARREISGPRSVVAIVREARKDWEKRGSAGAQSESLERRCACGKPVSIDGQCWECAAQ
jgi:hypothetical protein